MSRDFGGDSALLLAAIHTTLLRIAGSLETGSEPAGEACEDPTPAEQAQYDRAMFAQRNNFTLAQHAATEPGSVVLTVFVRFASGSRRETVTVWEDNIVPGWNQWAIEARHLAEALAVPASSVNAPVSYSMRLTQGGDVMAVERGMAGDATWTITGDRPHAPGDRAYTHSGELGTPLNL